jgi:hypothetical protein
MSFPIRASCFAVALIIAGPALAQQDSGPQGVHPAKHVAKGSKTTLADGSLQPGYMKACGTRFVCYTGIPLECGANTRPYQSVADHQCFCLRDNCPQ